MLGVIAYHKMTKLMIGFYDSKIRSRSPVWCGRPMITVVLVWDGGGGGEMGGRERERERARERKGGMIICA